MDLLLEVVGTLEVDAEQPVAVGADEDDGHVVAGAEAATHEGARPEAV